MSDVGKYAACEAEIANALVGLPGAMKIAPSLNATELVYRDGIQKPAIGIIHVGTDLRQVYSISSRQFLGTTKWALAFALDNLRGAVSGRPALYELLENARDRLHGLQSSQSPFGKYFFESEAYPEQQPDGLIVAVATFKLDLVLGQ